MSAEVPLRGRMALATGIEYGDHVDDSRSELSYDTAYGPGPQFQLRIQTRLRSIALPARLEWRPGHWRIGAGPEVRYLVDAQLRADLTPDGWSRDWFDITHGFNRWSLAAQLAAGRELPMGRHALRADLRWSEGLTRQHRVPDFKERTRAAQLAIGFLW